MILTNIKTHNKNEQLLFPNSHLISTRCESNNGIIDFNPECVLFKKNLGVYSSHSLHTLLCVNI